MFPPLPALFLSASQMPPLLSTVRAALAERHPNAPFLMSELQRAHVCAPEALPADTIAMNDWVHFNVDWDSPNRPCQLSYPADCQDDAKQLSVLTRLGAALLGLRINDRMPFIDDDGVFRLVTPMERLSFKTILPLARRQSRATHNFSAQRVPSPDPHDSGPDAA